MSVIDFKGSKCKNCYRCVRECAVKAIQVKNEQAMIMNDRCILCGHCLLVCPQNAKTLNSDLPKVKRFLREKQRVVVSLAPSYLSSLDYYQPEQVVGALKELGFEQVRETAEGAAYVSQAYQQLITANQMDNIITTCCPAVNDLIEIYYPDLVKFMAPVISPMIASGKIIKEELGKDVKVVFIGPCIAKKKEALEDTRCQGAIDAVLTFTELEAWLKEEGISIAHSEACAFSGMDPKVNRLYPISSGVLSSVLASEEKESQYRHFYVHGIENCMELFEDMMHGRLMGCFIEANICNGGCIKGPAIKKQKEAISRYSIKLDMEELIEKKAVDQKEMLHQEDLDLRKDFYDHSKEEKIPSEEEIKALLAKIGKFDRSQELNCGACGYPTYQGKAELTMCIPYMNERAQSMANTVLDQTPNIIMMVDDQMKILELSQAAMYHFRLPKSKAKEMYLFEFMDPSDFEEVFKTKQNIVHKKVRYPEYDLVTLQTIVYNQEHNTALGIFVDITKDEEMEKQAMKLKMDTVDMAQAVINKQMMVAQEIAGLLGETTAETKVTLTKLRDMILTDGKDEQHE